MRTWNITDKLLAFLLSDVGATGGLRAEEGCDLT